MVSFERVAQDSSDMDFCMRVYEESFPHDERRDFGELLRLSRLGKNIFLLIKDGDLPVGIAILFDIRKYFFLEYIAIDKNLRGLKYGTSIMEELKKKYKNIVLEVEEPESSDVAQRRVEWYKKIGFILNEGEYMMPSLGDSKRPVPLKIMSEIPIVGADFEELKNMIYKNVYFDKNIDGLTS